MWYKVNKRLIGTQQVRPSWYTPWSNTIAYFPFKENWLDKTGTYTLDNTGTQWTIGRIFTSSSNANTQFSTNTVFINMWIKRGSFNIGSGAYAQVWNWFLWTKWWICYNVRWWDSSLQSAIQYYYGNKTKTYQNVNSEIWEWFNLCYWYDWNWVIFYKNGVWTRVSTQTNPYNWWNWNQLVLFNNVTWNIELSEFIAESRFRTAEEIQNYYNQTKSKYWL